MFGLEGGTKTRSGPRAVSMSVHNSLLGAVGKAESGLGRREYRYRYDRIREYR